MWSFNHYLYFLRHIIDDELQPKKANQRLNLRRFQKGICSSILEDLNGIAYIFPLYPHVIIQFCRYVIYYKPCRYSNTLVLGL